MRVLSRQVKKLERRQEIELDLRETQERYYATVYQQVQTQLDAFNQELAKINKRVWRDKPTTHHHPNRDSQSRARGSRQDQFNELQNSFQNIVREKNNLERERAILMGKLQSEYSQAGKQNVGWLEGKIE